MSQALLGSLPQMLTGHEVNTTACALDSDFLTTTTSCLNLAQRLEKFHNCCDEYADNIPPQSRFHMKELLSQLESHTWQLRSSGAKSLLNCDPLLSTLKDVACVIKR